MFYPEQSREVEMSYKKQPPLYSVWNSMKSRCYQPNSRQFKDYGGRGIKVCQKWLDSYKAFEADMSPRPPGYTIDRIDNDGDYTPENCRWATRKQQMRNRRVNRWVTVEGKKFLAIELAEKIGVKMDTIVERAEKGLPMDKVMSTTKLTSYRKPVEAVAARIKSFRDRTHCKHGHEWTEENKAYTPQGWWRCRKCHAERELERGKQRRALLKS